MDKKLLDILVCPVTGAAVTPADADTIARVNALIEAGEARYADNSTVADPVQEALVTADHATLYRVDDDIPMMLPELGIELPRSA